MPLKPTALQTLHGFVPQFILKKVKFLPQRQNINSNFSATIF